MKKFFGLLLFTFACWAPSSAFAVTCFWVGSTATWDTTNTGGGGTGGIKWASASGGSTTCSGGGAGGSPASSDNATFDGLSGGGTVTVNFGGLITLAAFDMGAFTGTIDFATNNNSITLTGQNQIFSGAATKTLNMGSGTWTLSNTQPFWNCATCANLTLNAGTSTLAFTATTGTTARRLTGGGKTYATITIASAPTPFLISNANTIGTLTIAAGNYIQLGSNATQTITTMTNISGSSSAQTLFAAGDPLSSYGAMAITNNWTCDWCGFAAITFTGAGSKTGSFDFKGNSGITITPPSTGGGGRTIGG